MSRQPTGRSLETHEHPNPSLLQCSWWILQSLFGYESLLKTVLTFNFVFKSFLCRFVIQDAEFSSHADRMILTIAEAKIDLVRVRGVSMQPKCQHPAKTITYNSTSVDGARKCRMYHWVSLILKNSDCNIDGHKLGSPFSFHCRHQTSMRVEEELNIRYTWLSFV